MMDASKTLEGTFYPQNTNAASTENEKASSSKLTLKKNILFLAPDKNLKIFFIVSRKSSALVW